MVGSSPKTITIQGRLSFPTFSAQAAYERSQKGSYPAKSVAEAKPDFQLLIEQAQLDKLRKHIIDEFFPHCLEQSKNGSKKDELTATEIKDLTKQIKSDDFDGVYNTPFKPLSDDSAALAPETVATVKVIGNAGIDIEQKAVVRDETELLDADPDILSYPVIKPAGLTTHQLYPGAIVAVTVNLYAYHNGKLPGFSAGGSVAVFKADADRFGGGVTVDEDAIFMDD